MELITALGISWPTLLSQLINFGILYWLLKKFALDGLLEAMQKRQRDIEQGLQNAKAADTSLASATQQKEAILADARHQAQEIIAAARQHGQEQEQQILARAHDESQRVVADGVKQVEVAKGKMLLEVKTELADIIATGVTALVGAHVTPEAVTQEYLQAGIKESHEQN